jgi:flavin reductase (DIM6/NTAB) family NADH-FMN oxidoreductase RutF
VTQQSQRVPKVEPFNGDPFVVRNAFAQFPSGVAVLAAHVGDDRHALVASSFMVGVSLEPCLVAVAVQKSSETWQHLLNAPTLGVSILGRGQGLLTRQLASKDRATRFDQVSIDVDENGAILLEDAALWLKCSAHTVSAAGDHWMALLQVLELGQGDHEPIIWHGARFRELTDAATVDVG